MGSIATAATAIIVTNTVSGAWASPAKLGANLHYLPTTTALVGSEAVAWAHAALTALGAPATAANVKTMEDWEESSIPNSFVGRW
jgi:hypothetical protein